MRKEGVDRATDPTAIGRQEDCGLCTLQQRTQIVITPTRALAKQTRWAGTAAVVVVANTKQYDKDDGQAKNVRYFRGGGVAARQPVLEGG